MTKKKAIENFQRIEGGYFTLLDHFVYMAIVKKNDDLTIKDDYFIEIGEKDGSVNTIGSMMTNEIANDVNSGTTIFRPTKKISFQSFTSRPDYITGGVSISNLGNDNKRGSLGAIFKMNKSDDLYLITNYHVIVEGNDCTRNKSVVFPSRWDSDLLCFNKPKYKTIAEIIWCNNTDDLDVAIAKIDTNSIRINKGQFSLCDCLELKNISDAKIGDKVKLCGLSSKYKGRRMLRSTHCTVKIDNKNNKHMPTLFKNQILTNAMSIPGDSGSVLVNQDNDVVGLLFAGDEENVSFFNPIMTIFSLAFPDKTFEKFV